MHEEPTSRGARGAGLACEFFFTASRGRERTFWTTTALALVLSSLGSSETALAQACGPLDATNSATCTPANNPYSLGINYSTNNTSIFVTLESGVQVVIPAGGIANAVN